MILECDREHLLLCSRASAAAIASEDDRTTGNILLFGCLWKRYLLREKAQYTKKMVR
jgi:hypothetical protein